PGQVRGRGLLDGQHRRAAQRHQLLGAVRAPDGAGGARRAHVPRGRPRADHGRGHPDQPRGRLHGDQRGHELLLHLRHHRPAALAPVHVAQGRLPLADSQRDPDPAQLRPDGAPGHPAEHGHRADRDDRHRHRRGRHGPPYGPLQPRAERAPRPDHGHVQHHEGAGPADPLHLARPGRRLPGPDLLELRADLLLRRALRGRHAGRGRHRAGDHADPHAFDAARDALGHHAAQDEPGAGPHRTPLAEPEPLGGAEGRPAGPAPGAGGRRAADPARRDGDGALHGRDGPGARRRPRAGRGAAAARGPRPRPGLRGDGPAGGRAALRGRGGGGAGRGAGARLCRAGADPAAVSLHRRQAVFEPRAHPERPPARDHAGLRGGPGQGGETVSEPVEGYNYLIISDLHLKESEKSPAGRLFYFDQDFTDFLRHYRHTYAGARRWRLIVGGDFIEFYHRINEQPDPQNRLLRGSELYETDLKFYPGTEWRKSVWKLDRILRSHQLLLISLARFVHEGNEVYILRGNHDLEFYWTQVQDHFRALVAEHHPAGVTYLEMK